MAKENDSLGFHAEEFSLESILAEYKGTAYINGDKKTPAHILNEKTERIIMELTGGGTSGASLSSDAAIAADDAVSRHVDSRKSRKDSDRLELDDEDIRIFGGSDYSPSSPNDGIADEVERAIIKETGLVEDTREKTKKAFRIFGRDKAFDAQPEAFDGPYDEPEEYFEEPELKDAAKTFADACNSASLRYIASLLVSIIMAIATLTFEAGRILPFGIGRDISLMTGALLIAQLIVMMLCSDLILRGARNLICAAPNAESLALFSCVFSLISGAFSIFTGASAILPYCTVSAFSLTFALLGEKYYLRAITETLKTAVSAAEPYGVVAEYRQDIDRTVLKKTPRRTDGFYNNLVHPDLTETAYRFATPILLAAALVLAVFTVLAKDRGPYLLNILSAMLAAAASFSSIIAFGIPYASVARKARKSGAAVAGWGGADDIFYTDGTCVTDDDLFPKGTVSISGAKIFEEVSQEKAIRYSASLIIASGSGLTRVFSELLMQHGMSLIRVDDFACYEGGIGALIRGERVMTGSAAFMNLLGIRVPDEMNMKNAVFTAVNDRLIAMFAVNYVPANSVQSGLITILKWRIKLFFAVRDFNITPLMLGQKFMVSLDDIEYIPAQNSYSISDENAAPQGRVAAILTREGLGPFGEAVTGARVLRNAVIISTLLSILSAAAGVLIMFYLCWNGAFHAARPGNLLVFMFAMLAVNLVGCGFVKMRK